MFLLIKVTKDAEPMVRKMHKRIYSFLSKHIVAKNQNNNVKIIVFFQLGLSIILNAISSDKGEYVIDRIIRLRELISRIILFKLNWFSQIEIRKLNGIENNK
ncbi:MAG TPA: hypothetical protein PLR88_12480 [Bacteroidales bacterium]|nr:hypothetical protein [Bacteroidales bacterium]